MSIEQPDNPLATEPVPALREQERKQDQLKVEAVRGVVLIVEDDPANRELLVELTSSWGYEPIPVGSAEEAEFAAKRKELSAAIVDVFLPGRSGTALMSKLRGRFPHAVLIGMSALGDAGIARRMKGLGANLFITKPVVPEQLAEALQSEPQSWH